MLYKKWQPSVLSRGRGGGDTVGKDRTYGMLISIAISERARLRKQVAIKWAAESAPAEVFGGTA